MADEESTASLFIRSTKYHRHRASTRAEKLQNDKLSVQTFGRPSLNSQKLFSTFFRRERFTDRMTQCTSSGCFSYRAIS